MLSYQKSHIQRNSIVYVEQRTTECCSLLFVSPPRSTCLWASIKTYTLTPKHTCTLTLSVAQCGRIVVATMEYYTTGSLGLVSHQHNNGFKGAHKTFWLQLGPGTQSHWAWLLRSCPGNLDQKNKPFFLAARLHLRMKRGWNEKIWCLSWPKRGHKSAAWCEAVLFLLFRLALFRKWCFLPLILLPLPS